MELCNKDLLSVLNFAVLFSADKKELRQHLQNVSVKNVAGDCCIVAADGHRLVKIMIPDYVAPFNLELITRESITNCVRVKDYEFLILKDGFQRGNFPAYERLIPEPDDKPLVDVNDMPAFNAMYLGEAMTGFYKLSKAIAGNKYNIVEITRLDLNGANVFKAKLNGMLIEMIIMPCRK